jgi:hypothetical protein
MKTNTLMFPLFTLLAAVAIANGAAEFTLESAPPVVVKTSPIAGATDVDPTLTEIEVTYSKPMQGGIGSWSTWGEENFPEMVGEPKYLPDGRTCVATVKLRPGKFYAIWLNSEKFGNFKDTNGRPAVPYLLTFRTAATAGTVASVEVGDKRAEPVLKSGLKDSEAAVQQNAQAAINMLKIAQPAADRPGESENFPRPEADANPALNADQRAVLAWTDRQFRSYFDDRTFSGWSEEERKMLESKSLDALKGPQTRDYYQAIGTLAALRATNALPKLRGIAFERVDRNNRDRWMSVRALGLMGDRESVPDLIHLVYHGNINTRWWAQISLVRLTGQNFGKDWHAWGNWWNDQNGRPPFTPEIIRWWGGQAEPDKLAESLEVADRKFFEQLK